MDIYTKLREVIVDLLECKTKSDSNGLKMLIKYLPYPENLKNILGANPELGIKILNRYNQITEYYIESDNTLENLLDFLNKKLINKTNNPLKNNIIQVETQIYNYLQEQNFFQKSYDELGISNVQVTKQDIIGYKKENTTNLTLLEQFDWRINQIEAIEHVKTHGITTGIHCQATGCGKTFIILKYIDFAYKSNSKCKIILFTERVSILADLFDFESIKSNQLDSMNLKFWKDKGICDLTQFNIIDRVTVKKSDWVEQLNKSTQPTLLVINRAYLTLNSNYKNINGLSLVLHDECHNVASNKCFEFLKFIKNKQDSKKLVESIGSIGSVGSISNTGINSDKKIKRAVSSKSKSESDSKSKPIPIVGFSATPLRAAKTKSGENNILNRDRLIEIYGLDGNLNLITNYNMIYAISSNLILPPRFYWFDIENYQIKDKESKTKKQISKPELGSVMKILDEIIPFMHNRKFVGWCGTIPLCDEWYENFVSNKDMYPNLKNLKLFRDYSKKNTDLEILGYDQFKVLKSDGIMFCAQKHREGSDIAKLDGCVFLDKVKVRGSIPFIQSIGRVLRKESDPDSKKTCGFVIDGVVRDNEDYEKNFVDKILGYYFALNDIASLEEDNPGESTYDQYFKLIDMINFDPDEKIIKLKLDKITIEINCKKLDWANIIKNFDSILGKKINLNPDEKIRAEFEKLKQFALKIKNNGYNLVKSWKKIAKKEDLPIEPNKIYHKFWKGWYDFYQIDISKFLKTKKEWVKQCKKIKLNPNNYYEIICNHANLPELPEEIYQDFKNLKIELENISNIDNNKIELI